jgi:hypothetical protein
MNDTDAPTSVTVYLRDQEIPDERIKAWTDEWYDLRDEVKREHADNGDALSGWLEKRAVEWTQQVFMETQGHHDLHHWVTGYEVNFDD